MKLDVHTIISRVLREAHASRHAAAMDGSWSDGGASQAERDVRFYQEGLAGTIPAEWLKYQTQEDAEFKEYERLKAKFG